MTTTHPTGASRSVGRTSPWYTENEHGSGRVGLTVRAEPGQSHELVASDPERFELPKYIARHGWVTYFLDLKNRPIDWEEVGELVGDSYRIQAPSRLIRLLEDSPS